MLLSENEKTSVKKVEMNKINYINIILTLF